jgi:RecA/RadA recombinase
LNIGLTKLQCGIALVIGGLPRGRVIEIYGPECLAHLGVEPTREPVAPARHRLRELTASISKSKCMVIYNQIRMKIGIIAHVAGCTE